MNLARPRFGQKLRQFRGVAADHSSPVPVEILNCVLDTAIWREIKYLESNIEEMNRVSGTTRGINVDQSMSLQGYFVRWIEVLDTFEYTL